MSLSYDHALPPLLQVVTSVLIEPSSTKEFTTIFTFFTNPRYHRQFFLLAITMESDSNLSVGWPGFKMAGTKGTQRTHLRYLLYIAWFKASMSHMSVVLKCYHGQPDY